jgi:uncharacterized protein with von Willebrand factor type A (vWA) domain
MPPGRSKQQLEQGQGEGSEYDENQGESFVEDELKKDFEELLRASEEMEHVAEKINEVKKRKDVVEKYVEGKGKVNVM